VELYREAALDQWLLTFLIYVDDLAKLLERYGIVIRLFADDVKVYLEIVNSNDASKLVCPWFDNLVGWWMATQCLSE